MRRAEGCMLVNAQVVQPRRIAAKAAARRMAVLLGERVGARVGFVTRLERRVSAQTRAEVVTTGVLLRRLQLVRMHWNTLGANHGVRAWSSCHALKCSALSDELQYIFYHPRIISSFS